MGMEATRQWVRMRLDYLVRIFDWERPAGWFSLVGLESSLVYRPEGWSPEERSAAVLFIATIGGAQIADDGTSGSSTEDR